MLPLIHSIHLLAAGIWLGGLFFTATVVTPAFRQMKWNDIERLEARSALGRQYAKVARFNLLVLIGAALAEAAMLGFGYPAVAELVVIGMIGLLSEMHARIYAPRLVAAAKGEIQADRRQLLRVSIGVSMFNLAASIALVVLAGLIQFRPSL